MGNAALAGSIFLLHTPDNARFLTLIENKHQIADETQLRNAQRQAIAYARAKRLIPFLIAAPEGMWVYRRHGNDAELIEAVAPNELQRGAPRLLELIQTLDRR